MDYRQRKEKAFEEGRGDRTALSLREFLSIELPEPDDGDTWGNWTFQKGNLTLQYRSKDNFDYEVNLEELDTTLDVVVWLKHLSEKAYMTAEDIGNFFLAIQDLSGAWYTTTTNVSELIRKKYGGGRTAEDGRE
jgi:hypothetical protein